MVAGGTVSVPFVNIGEYGAETLTELVNRYVQSEGEMDLAEHGLDLHLTLFTGPGKAGTSVVTLDSRSTDDVLEWLRKKPGVVDTPLRLRETNDNMCLAYALIIGKTFAEKGQTEIQRLCKSITRLQHMGLKLCRESNLPPNTQMGIPEIEILAKGATLSKFRILCYTETGEKFYDSDGVGRDSGFIYLVLACDHFMMVRANLGVRLI